MRVAICANGISSKRFAAVRIAMSPVPPWPLWQAVTLGSLTAILLAGFLNWVGKRRPHLTGEGRLQPGVGEELVAGEEKAAASTVDASAIGAAGVTAIALYLLGTACFKLFGLPGPVAMLFLAVAVKLTRAVPPSLQLAGQVVYRFFATAVTYPLLFAIGVSLTPWDTLVAALTPANIAVIGEHHGDLLAGRLKRAVEAAVARSGDLGEVDRYAAEFAAGRGALDQQRIAPLSLRKDAPC